MRLSLLLLSLLACMPFDGKAADTDSPDAPHFPKHIVEPTRAMGLGSLRTANLNGIAGEVRVWISESYANPEMVRFVIGPHGEISGASYFYYYANPGDDSSRIDEFFSSFFLRCDAIDKSKNMRACKEQGIPSQRFVKAYSTIAAAGIWHLASAEWI